MKKNIKIIDNFLDKEIFKKLQSFLLSNNFPWFYNESKVRDKSMVRVPSPIEGYDSVDQHQFTHTFLGNELNFNWSNWASHITPLLDKIKPRVWVRIKSNLTNITSKPEVSGWHYDKNENNGPWTDTTTSIFYVNTNNGYTVFENGKKIPSLENRLAIFPNHLMHTGVSQTDTKIRVTLNLNYLGKQ